MKQPKQDGTSRYFEEIQNHFKQKSHLLLGLCFKYLKDFKAAEDAMMDTFELALIKSSSFEIQNMGAWLAGIARNHCLQILRRQKGKYQCKFLADLHSPCEIPGWQNLQTDVKNEVLEIAMQRINILQRTCITLFFLEGNTYQEVVNISGISLKNVKSYLQNGKRMLLAKVVEILKEKGISKEDLMAG